jgi:hypothetical protein
MRLLLIFEDTSRMVLQSEVFSTSPEERTGIMAASSGLGVRWLWIPGTRLKRESAIVLG